MEKGGGLVRTWGFTGFMVENQGFSGKMGVLNGGIVENRGFSGKCWVFSENGVFVGFWSRIRGK